MARLRDLSKKFSPKLVVPPLPGQSATPILVAPSLDDDESMVAPGSARHVARASGSDGATQPDAYLAAIEKLSSNMDYLASKTDVEQMKTAVLVQTKVMISEAVDPIKSEFHTLKDRIDLLEQRPAIGEARVDETLAQ
jgi:hypothetical protein